ncbi:contractile injection system tape measure protein [Mucilaginibacter sp. CAU 1740]|uniref:contractile injection system tape measure protein n=1 Tax=Mucilaginibacter sp. CAU 1740 TaxID=3140365 RepID=UPI00325A7B8A
MAKGKHIIHKLVLNIEVPRRNTAQQVQDDAVRHFEQVLMKQLELLLDKMDVPNHVLIDKIDLDLGSGKLEDVFEQLTASLAKVLDPVLNPSILPNTEEEEAEIRHLALTEEQKAFDVFVYFITTGRLPWYAAADTDWLQQEDLWFSKLLSVLARESVLRSKLSGVFKTSVLAVNRLFKQFSISSVKKLLIVLLTIEEQQVQKTVELIVQQVQLKIAGKGQESNAKTNTSLPEDIAISISHNKKSDANEPDLDRGTLLAIIEKMLFALYVRKGEFSIISEEMAGKMATLLVESFKISTQPSISKLIEIAATILKQQEQQPIAQKNKPTATTETDPIQKEDEGGVYVSQAGLVILHPFLEYFFKDFGLLQDNDFVDLPARQLAVHLLHYLGTGNTNAFEYDLYFEKFLCRWPADEPLERDVEIPQRMLDEADNMLLTVIKYWKALKNTSPGGLREGFLNRNGKLIEAEQPARLIVERMDMDILLSTLPWGMGVIKLPWMVEPFYVEWQ